MTGLMDIQFKYDDLLKEIKSLAPFEPETALILGSGLGEFANVVNTIKSIPTTDLIGYPESTVQGHKGYIHFAEHNNKKLLIFQGRIHFYEGYKIYECVLPVLIAYKLGCKNLILTNAAGGINQNFNPADLMLITSLNTINIKKEITDLVGLTSLDSKNRSLDFPSQKISNAIKQAALSEEIPLKEGVYYFTKGPSYETPAEIKMMQMTSNDAVGMSTAHEALFGLTLGLQVAAVSCITNMAAGISQVKLSHTEVMETAEVVKEQFEKLIKKTIELL